MPNYFESNRDKLFFVRRAGKFDHEIGRRGCIKVYVDRRGRASETDTGFRVISTSYVRLDADIDPAHDASVPAPRFRPSRSARRRRFSLLRRTKDCQKLR
jgi:hypothetical protein